MKKKKLIKKKTRKKNSIDFEAVKKIIAFFC